MNQFLFEVATERNDGIERIRPYDEHTFIALEQLVRTPTKTLRDFIISR